jgi:hypothetical protein
MSPHGIKAGTKAVTKAFKLPLFLVRCRYYSRSSSLWQSAEMSSSYLIKNKNA